MLDPRFRGDGEGDCGRNPTEHLATMIHDLAINNDHYSGGPGDTQQGYTISNITKLHLGARTKMMNKSTQKNSLGFVYSLIQMMEP